MKIDLAEVRCLESIVTLNMSPQEAKACKLCYLYQEMVGKIFPDTYNVPRIAHDPRKSFLFKCCFKCIREIQHKLDNKLYKLYIRAQLDIVKVNNRRLDMDPYISPNLLVGPKAWMRWLVWKRLYDRKSRSVDSATVENKAIHEPDKIKLYLLESKEFLSKKLPSLDKANITKVVDNRTLLRWLAVGQITPYYALLSPVLHGWLENRKLTLEDLFQIDFHLYRPGVSEDITVFFKKEFEHEFN